MENQRNVGHRRLIGNFGTVRRTGHHWSEFRYISPACAARAVKVGVRNRGVGIRIQLNGDSTSVLDVVCTIEGPGESCRGGNLLYNPVLIPLRRGHTNGENSCET